jgi:predicted O-methyltransferase YrrM
MARNSTGGSHLVGAFKQRLQGIPRTPRELNYSLQMLSVMRGLGWHQSVAKIRSTDHQRHAKPWYTYAALEWLAPRVKRTHRVFEFGGGYSTVWYGEHVGEVVTVEHDGRWLDEVRTMVGPNVTLLHRDTPGDEANSEGDSPYYSAIEEYPPQTFDIIVIDGMERNRCAPVAPPRLRDGGLIIFDNSDRPSFRPGIKHLHSQGFGRLDFYGFVAAVGTRNCTSVFSRQFDSSWSTENVPLVWQGW